MSHGFELSPFALARAAETAFVSCPSTRTAFQPHAAKRATSRKTISLVVDQAGPKPGVEQPLRECHADGVGEALAEGPRRCLDARRMAVLGMAGGLGAELAEALELGDVN